jgi:hypothetical protein
LARVKKTTKTSQRMTQKKKKRNSRVSLEISSTPSTPTTPDTPTTAVGSPMHAKEISGVSLDSFEELQTNLTASVQENESLKRTIADQNLLLQAQQIKKQVKPCFQLIQKGNIPH